MTVKLLALDLDGTIFGDDLLISEKTRRAIRAAQERGVLVTIATGRMYTSAAQVAGDLSVNAPIICYQGALIRDNRTGETLLHKTVPALLAHAVMDEVDRLGLHLNVYLDDKLYVARMTPEALFYSQINRDLHVSEVGDLHDWLDAQGGPELTKMVIVTDPDVTDGVLADFSLIFARHLQVIKSHPRFTEFTNKDCSKGKALASLAGSLHLNRDNVMAIGDGHNDLDMIEWAGYGFAMPTAPQAVLDIARSVCLPIAEDGAADVIERYILGKA